MDWTIKLQYHGSHFLINAHQQTTLLYVLQRVWCSAVQQRYYRLCQLSGGLIISFPDSEQDCYLRTGVLWQHACMRSLMKQLVITSIKIAVVKGRPNMNSGSFCRWVSDTLCVRAFSNQDFPGILELTLHESSFMSLALRCWAKKGVYIDGHERTVHGFSCLWF